MPGTKPAYASELRQRILDLARAGRTPASLAREFEPTETTIRNWVAQAARDVKKSSCVVRAGDRRDATKAFEYMSRQQRQYSVATMSRLLGVSRSGFYAWAERGPSQRACQDSLLGTGIQRIHEYSRGTCGAPRIHAELAFGGTHVGRKRVARLMHGKGLRGVSRRKWTTTTVRDRTAVLAPDLVKRDFRAQGPNRLWVADITYVPTWAGFLYVAVVVDAWSRRVVGWAFAVHLRAELVLAALEMAIRQRQPRDVVHHSDHGSQGEFNGPSQHPWGGELRWQQENIESPSERCGPRCSRPVARRSLVVSIGSSFRRRSPVGWRARTPLWQPGSRSRWEHAGSVMAAGCRQSVLRRYRNAICRSRIGKRSPF